MFINERTNSLWQPEDQGGHIENAVVAGYTHNNTHFHRASVPKSRRNTTTRTLKPSILQDCSEHSPCHRFQNTSALP